jgi:hypothetical protein
MKKRLLTLSLLFVAAVTYAQVGNFSLQEYADFKKRTLIVVVEEPNANLVGKLNANQQAVYNKEIEEYNALVKWAIENYYKAGSPVEYKTVTETMDIINKKDKSYAYLSFTKFKNNYKTKVSFEMTQKNRIATEETRLSGALSIDFIVSLIEIRFAENNLDAYPIYGQYLPSPFPGKADMAYALKQIAAVLNDREQGISFDDARKNAKKDAAKAQSQTLLIAENIIGPNEDRGKFVSRYKFPLKITTPEKINEAIINGNSQFTCTITVPTHNFTEEKVEFKFMMYDCGSGKTVATSVSQERTGVSTGALSALKALKRVVTESKVPPIKKENMADFYNAVR